jgi:hypothetical protein
LDWYRQGNGQRALHQAGQGFSPLTGIHWIGTDTAEVYVTPPTCMFQSPDGDSLDWYMYMAIDQYGQTFYGVSVP